MPCSPGNAEIVGAAVYPVFSRMSHSCAPNAFHYQVITPPNPANPRISQLTLPTIMTQVGLTQTVKALRPIAKVGLCVLSINSEHISKVTLPVFTVE